MRALITGATSGIGRAFAFAFSKRGYNLVIGGRRDGLLRETADELQNQHGISVHTVPGDLADPTVEAEFMRHIAEAPLDALVNNAGSGLSSRFAETNPDRLMQIWNLLAAVPTRLSREAVNHMSEGSTIINVGSLAGRLAVPGATIYVAAKSYMERFSETLALELAPRGIVVQALTPGYVRTDFHRDVENYKAKQKSSGLIRWSEPEDVVCMSLKAADRAARRLRSNPGRAPRARDVVVIPGFLNRFLAGFSRFVPRSILYAAAESGPRVD